jgi:hypothetical protein
VLKNIQGGAFDPLGRQHTEQSRLVNHRTPPHVDHHCRRFHDRELRLSNHVPRFRC